MNRQQFSSTLGVALACLFGLACSEGGAPAPSPKTAGGQSGTDSNSSGGCDNTPLDVALDAHIPILEVSGDDLFELVGGKHEVPGAWLASGEPVTLTVDIERIESAHLDSNCGPGHFGVVAHVFTSDGSIDASVTELRLEAQRPALLVVPVAELPDGVAPAGSSGSGAILSVKLTLSNDESPTDVEASLDVGYQIAAWSSRPWELEELDVVVPSLYTAPAVMRAACGDAPEANLAGEYTPFASESKAREAAIGTWVDCQKPVVDDTVGFRIGADGSVVDLVQHEGEVVARGGFGHESDLIVSDGSVMHEKPGLVWIYASSASGFLWNGALVAGDERGARLLLRTDESFGELASPFVSMQRAGSAACGSAEAGLVRLDAVETLQSLLAGSWTRCSGSLPNGAEGITFDGAEQLAFLDDAGAPLDSSRCDVAISGFMTGELLCPDFETTAISTLVTVATRPLMLAVEQRGRRAIFSALP